MVIHCLWVVVPVSKKGENTIVSIILSREDLVYSLSQAYCPLYEHLDIPELKNA